MSTIRLNLAEVEVKHGDCVPENKLGEGSNAWTKSYFASAKDDFKGYQISLEHLKQANVGACLNPCPPFFRGEEVSADAIDSEYFVGYEFKKSLLEVQQAIICYLLGCV